MARPIAAHSGIRRTDTVRPGAGAGSYTEAFIVTRGNVYEREIVYRIWEQSGTEANGTALSEGGSGVQRHAVRL